MNSGEQLCPVVTASLDPESCDLTIRISSEDARLWWAATLAFVPLLAQWLPREEWDSLRSQAIAARQQLDAEIQRYERGRLAAKLGGVE